jgi:hypothetical protein
MDGVFASKDEIKIVEDSLKNLGIKTSGELAQKMSAVKDNFNS